MAFHVKLLASLTCHRIAHHDVSAAPVKTRYFNLPPIRQDARPLFVDTNSCRKWLDTLLIDNAGRANALLYAQIELFSNAVIEPNVRLDTLELLRPKVLAVQTEHAKKFRGKALPLSPQRREVLSEVASLWDVLGRAYQRCLEQLSPRDPDILSRRAMACQRALDCSRRRMSDHHFAYVQVSEGDFRLLHRLYSFAERGEFTRYSIRDPLATGEETTSCVRTYVHALLFDAATPREHRMATLHIILGWLDRWSGKVSVSSALPEPGVAALHVNLASAAGTSREPSRGINIRYFDMSSLSQSISKRVHGLRHGKKPAELDLGAEINAREAETLLVALHRQWCDASPRRTTERTALDQVAHVSTGLNASHFYIGKKTFEQPLTAGNTQAQKQSDLRVKAATEFLMTNGIRAEQWLIRDESMTGIGLTRPLGEADDSRLLHNQLVSIRSRGNGMVWIGTIQWMQQTVDGDLNIGARLVPGIPVAISARCVGQPKFFQALLLEPIPALNAPTSLLLPLGSYSSQGVVEIYKRGLERIRLTGLLEAGTDYERVAFMNAGA